MTTPTLLRQLEQLEAQASLLVAAARSIRMSIEETAPKAPAVAAVDDSDGVCLHPQDSRQSIPVMGHPNRFHCTRCGGEGGLGLKEA